MRLANLKANTHNNPSSMRITNTPSLRNKLTDFGPSLLQHPNVSAFPQIICSSLFPFPSPCVSSTSVGAMPLGYQQQMRSFSWHARASTENSSQSRNPLRPFKNLGEKVGEQLAFASPPFPTTERAERRGDPDLTKNEAKLQNERTGMDVAWTGPHGAENIPADRPEETYIPNQEGGGGIGKRNQPSNTASSGGHRSEEEKRKKVEEWKREGEEVEKLRLDGREPEPVSTTTSSGNFGGSTSQVRPEEFNQGTLQDGNKNNNKTTATGEGKTDIGLGRVGASGSTGGVTGRGVAETNAAGVAPSESVGSAGGVGAAAGSGGVGGAGGTGNIGTKDQRRSFSHVTQTPQGTSNTNNSNTNNSNNNNSNNNNSNNTRLDNNPKAQKTVNRDNGRERLGRDESNPAEKAAYEGMKSALEQGQSAPNYSNPTAETFRRDQATREHSEFAKNRVVGQPPQAKTN